MKRKLLILFLMLSIPVFGQELRPRPVEPIRVSVAAPQNEVNEEMARAVRDELRKLRDIVITETEGRAEFIIQANAMPIVAQNCGGVVAAVLIVRRSDGVQALSAYAGRDSAEVSKFIVTTVNRENFETLRARAISRER